MMAVKVTSGVIVGERVTVEWLLPPGSAHWLDFKVYQIAGWAADGSGVVDYRRDGWVSSGDFTTVLSEAELLLSGFIKWDGCNEWRMPVAHVHECDPGSFALLVAEAERIVHRAASQFMAAYQPDVRDELRRALLGG